MMVLLKKPFLVHYLLQSLQHNDIPKAASEIISLLLKTPSRPICYYQKNSKINCVTFKPFIICPYPTTSALFPSASHHHTYSSHPISESTIHIPVTLFLNSSYTFQPLFMLFPLKCPFCMFYLINSCHFFKTQCFSIEK